MINDYAFICHLICSYIQEMQFLPLLVRIEQKFTRKIDLMHLSTSYKPEYKR